MILQSHNSWSYLSPKKWWLWPFRFTAKCQRKTIFEQYIDYGVRSFDLRIRFNSKGELVIAHGWMEYKYTIDELYKDLDFINVKECHVRILHEARNKSQYTDDSIKMFREFCSTLEKKYPNIKFYCGKNLYTWTEDYEFSIHPTELEVYSSVCPPKIIDDWIPILFAKLNNKKTLSKEIKEDILSIDFVDIR